MGRGSVASGAQPEPCRTLVSPHGRCAVGGRRPTLRNPEARGSTRPRLAAARPSSRPPRSPTAACVVHCRRRWTPALVGTWAALSRRTSDRSRRHKADKGASGGQLRTVYERLTPIGVVVGDLRSLGCRPTGRVLRQQGLLSCPWIR
eukprot:3702321-Pleurochrysis_carterae.AAC.2